MTTPFPFVSGQVLTAAQLNDIQNLPISDKTASYTLLVTDVFKRTIMNSASATTITVDDSIFTVGDVIQVANKGAGVCTITAGAGVTINTSGSLDLAQYGGGYLLALSASTFTFFNLGGAAKLDVDFLVLAGGGSGGQYNGTSGYQRGISGSDSYFANIRSVGGGGGGGFSPSLVKTGFAGGCGGGSVGNAGAAGGSGTANQGYAGGAGSSSDYAGGGGGGTGAVGVAGSGSTGGAGGAGVASSITGSSVTRGGGGGGTQANATAGAGGTGGGGAGNTNGSGTSGGTNLGGGGGAGESNGAGEGGGGAGGLRCSVTATGGGGSLESAQVCYKNTDYAVIVGAGGASIGGGSGQGGAGGSGIAILRYLTAGNTITVGAGLTSSSATDGSYTVVSITAGSGLVSWA
jgi:hypothetical protein